MNGKGKKGFLLPPAVGYSWKVIAYLLRRYRISFTYLFRVIITLLINLVNTPFRLYEKWWINPKFQNNELLEPPVFVLGHWRSGTTHLHNILCQDPKTAYVTTFQSVFPDTTLGSVGRALFEGFAKLLIPGTRKGDNVVLGTELPQEEEFALGDKTPISVYYFWMFPRHLITCYYRYIRFDGIDPSTIESWKKDMYLLINKSIKNTGKPRFVSKNPPHTARVELLLDMYPNARFIHIHRNPVEVYLSTRNFFEKMLPHLQIQTVDQTLLNEQIFELYRLLMNDYLKQRASIPDGQLIEVAFEDLEAKPMAQLKEIYTRLNLSGFEEASPYFEAYLKKMSSYKKNEHFLSKDLLDRIMNEWSFAMKEWGYQLPDHIKIQND